MSFYYIKQYLDVLILIITLCTELPNDRTGLHTSQKEVGDKGKDTNNKYNNK